MGQMAAQDLKIKEGLADYDAALAETQAQIQRAERRAVRQVTTADQARTDRAQEMGEIDVAVHSLKDVTVTLAEHLVLAAFMPREDPRDCLIGPSATLAGLPQGSGGVTLNRLCGSGMDAVAMAARISSSSYL